MHKALLPRYDIDRLYVSRKEAGRGLASIQYIIDALVQWFEDYIKKEQRKIYKQCSEMTQPSTEQQ